MYHVWNDSMTYLTKLYHSNDNSNHPIQVLMIYENNKLQCPFNAGRIERDNTLAIKKSIICWIISENVKKTMNQQQSFRAH